MAGIIPWIRILGIGIIVFSAIGPLHAQGELSDPPWRYTFTAPGEDWQQPTFEDRNWEEGAGGFGNPTTPGSRVGTEWGNADIWMRRTIVLSELPAHPQLYLHYDEDVEVYINGKEVLRRKGFLTEYTRVPIDASLLKKGENAIAVHCHQTGGGQFIDVHVIDASDEPKLPRPKLSTQPFRSELITRWGREVTPENAWTEYPRPQMKRDQWTNLNGMWEWAVERRDGVKEPAIPEKWSGSILVPFCLESKLGGVQRKLLEDEVLWYHRTIDLPKQENRKQLIHFEAVDYRCRIYVNGMLVDSHVGGNIAFTVDATRALRVGSNDLVVCVEDETEGSQLRGKQSRFPAGIWYTQVSGIWQTVWMESVPQASIERLSIASNADAGTITVTTFANLEDIPEAARTNYRIRAIAKDGDRQVAVGSTKVGEPNTLRIERAHLWTPDDPHLYSLDVELLDNQGVAVDRVESYAGVRTFGTVRDPNGNLRFSLNGQPIFHWGPLDQGWWPDGLLTPPSDEALLFDIEFLKCAGFNMIRKHIKVEPRRFYYHCDRLGMLIWQDQVSGGRFAPWTHMAPNPTDAEWTDRDHDQFMVEFDAMCEQLENVTSLAVWTPFNEAWGQHRTMEVGAWIMKRDPSRLVNIASGGNFWPVGHIADEHSYPHPAFPFDQKRFEDYVRVVGEFGGHGWVVQGHIWDRNKDNWGYGGLPKNEEEYRARYRESIRILADLKQRGISGGVYTQTTDVEGEVNGLMTYDREVIKIPAEELKAIHAILK